MIGQHEAAALLELCAVAQADRRDCLQLLLSAPSPGATHAFAVLTGRLGRFTDDPAAPDPGIFESDWLCALLRFAPALAGHHASLGIDQAITAGTLADVGLQIAVHRLAHGQFGLETWA
ncbi:acyltransferase domain-containing protein [Paeniglutamicibacter cryotolerans]|uniref:acyltransferase domain-containing protein n=1 Tax=Paeniglutamicibacter cryotolerans TaxID=670079 RepID=UPI001613B31B|nr:acyltransferase domain-containing protein [Paeniglutamicibacter cryotolerans]